MQDINNIEKQIKKLDFGSRFLGKSEIKELPNILWEDETVEDIIQGIYNKKNGLLVASNKRLIFIEKGILWGLNVEDFDYGKISSIQYKNGILFGDITIYASGNQAKIENTLKDQCQKFCEHVRAMITGIHTNEAKQYAEKKHKKEIKEKAKSMQTHSDKDELLAKLERLSKLKKDGMLNEEEFAAAKMKLLGL